MRPWFSKHDAKTISANEESMLHMLILQTESCKTQALKSLILHKTPLPMAGLTLQSPSPETPDPPLKNCMLLVCMWAVSTCETRAHSAKEARRSGL